MLLLSAIEKLVLSIVLLSVLAQSVIQAQSFSETHQDISVLCDQGKQIDKPVLILLFLKAFFVDSLTGLRVPLRLSRVMKFLENWVESEEIFSEW